MPKGWSKTTIKSRIWNNLTAYISKGLGFGKSKEIAMYEK
jgi:hypothetical protein